MLGKILYLTKKEAEDPRNTYWAHIKNNQNRLVEVADLDAGVLVYATTYDTKYIHNEKAYKCISEYTDFENDIDYLVMAPSLHSSDEYDDGEGGGDDPSGDTGLDANILAQMIIGEVEENG